jgi:hypothetical protein
MTRHARHLARTTSTSRRSAILVAALALATAVFGSATALGSADVSAAAAADATASGYGIFGTDTVPTDGADADMEAVELGMVFHSGTAGWIEGLRYYRPGTMTPASAGSLWTSRGQLLARAAYQSVDRQGWVTTVLDEPVAIAAGVNYVASYSAPNGHYADDDRTLGGGLTLSHGDLTATAGVFTYGDTVPTSTWRQSNYFADVLFTTVDPTPEQPPMPTAPPSSTADVPTTSSLSSSAVSTSPVAPSSPAAPSSGFPGAANTGVPEGTTLSGYTGPCTITVANTVIDRKAVGCDVVIKAAGVKITNSSINGRLVSNSGGSVSVTDSLINGGAQETFPSVSYENLSLLRVEVIGGQHSVQCSANCTVQDSWLHGQYIGAGSPGHVNAFISNGGSNFKLIHNTLHCTVQPTSVQGGCTADASLFGDFGPIANAVFDRNLFKANSTGAGYCLQAGYNPSKAYPNPTGVVVTNNVFERGGNNKCGIYGPVTAFLKTAPGAGWSNNTFADGAVINP